LPGIITVGAKEAGWCAPTVFAVGNRRCGFTAVLSLARPRSAYRVPKDDTAPLATGHISPAGKHSPLR
jgi:hypothetical protein